MSSVHDRARSSAAGPSSFTGTLRRPSSPKPHHHHRHGAQGQAPQPTGSAAAKESFLNYFFGQNGPGPLAGASVDRASVALGGGASTITPVGRDVSGGEAHTSGLLAGKRNLEGNNAAFDMKSLGKHIEAVSSLFYCVRRALD